MEKRHGHYCIICGEYKANEKFSGKGHKARICKKCSKLEPEKLNEIKTIKKLLDLPFHLSSVQLSWLKQMQESDNPDIKEAAEWAYDLRFAPENTIEETDYYEDFDDIDLDDVFF